MFEEDLSYFENKDFIRTLHDYEAARKEGRNIYLDADELTDIAEYYMVNNQEEMASQAISLAIQLHPDSIDPQIFLSRQEMFHNNLENAYRICNAIPNQNDREVTFLRAELLIRQERYDEAEDLLREACEREEEEKDAFIYDSVGIFIDYGLWDEAKEWCTWLKDINPHYKGLEEQEAEINVYTGNYDEAAVLLNHILDDNPYNLKAWNMLAETYRMNGQHKEAQDACNFALAIDEHNFTALTTMGNIYFVLSEYEQAHDYFMQALEQKQDDVVAHMDALCLFHMEKYELSAEQLKIAGTLAGDDQLKQLSISMQEALVYGHLHKLDLAMEKLNFVHPLLKDKTLMVDYEVLYGQILLENQQAKQAKAHFQKALQISNEPDKIALIIGITYYETGIYDEAIRLLETFLSDASYAKEMDYALPYLALCFMKLRKAPQYIEYLRMAAEKCPVLTQNLFEDYFPGVAPEDYYLYAYKNAYGCFPEE